MKRLILMLPIMLSLVLLPMGATAQQASGSPAETTVAMKHAPMHHDTGKTSEETAAECLRWREKLQAMDESLNEKVVAMNEAKGDAKLAAMAAVLNELVAQRKDMREMMSWVHHDKMGRMCAMMDHRMDMRGMHGGAMMHHGTAGVGQQGTGGTSGSGTGAGSSQ